MPTHTILITRLIDDKFYATDGKLYETNDNYETIASVLRAKPSARTQQRVLFSWCIQHWPHKALFTGIWTNIRYSIHVH